jgi:hypothetical protein
MLIDARVQEGMPCFMLTGVSVFGLSLSFVRSQDHEFLWAWEGDESGLGV